MPQPRLLLVCVTSLAFACGGPSRSVAVEEPVAEVDPGTLPPAAPPTREGAIARAELDQVLAGGPGRFLQQVETEPHLEEGRFVGFRLRALRAPWMSGVDLREGDTLVSVNGMPVERPEQALSVWNGLHVASELTVEILRDGEPRQLRFAIEEE